MKTSSFRSAFSVFCIVFLFGFFKTTSAELPSYFDAVFNSHGIIYKQKEIQKLLSPFLLSPEFMDWKEQFSRRELLKRAAVAANNITSGSKTSQNAGFNWQNFLQNAVQNMLGNEFQNLIQNGSFESLLHILNNSGIPLAQNKNFQSLLGNLQSFVSTSQAAPRNASIQNLIKSIGPLLSSLQNSSQTGTNSSADGNNIFSKGITDAISSIMSNPIFGSLLGQIPGLDGNSLSKLLSGGLSAGNIASFAIMALQQRMQYFNSSDACKNDAIAVLSGLRDRQPWALQMLDASAKIPTELLNLNLNWYGSYDECYSKETLVSKYHLVPETTPPVGGQYCTVNVRLPLPPAIETSLKAFGGAGGVRMDMCLPKSCSVTDLYILVNGVLASFPLGGKAVTAWPIRCPETAEDMPYTTADIAMIITCGVFVFLMVLGTLYDVIDVQLPKWRQSRAALSDESSTGSNSKEGSTYKLRAEIDEKCPSVINRPPETVFPAPPVTPKEPDVFGKILMSFSVYTNGRKILNTDQPKGSLTAVNGIRFLSMSWVILGHTLAFVLGTASNMGTYYTDFISRGETQAITNALVSVDTFFVLSGLLTSYLLLRQMKKSNGWINWFMFYFHRFWRLTPVYMLVIGFYATIMHHMMFGPNQMARDETCKKSWWWNLLYISNFKKTAGDICLGWSWYLNNDMQFYVISPLMLVPLFFMEAIGIVITAALLLAVTITTGVLSYENHWPPSVMGGGDETANQRDAMFMDYYVKPYTRMGPYICGIITGFILYKTKNKCRMNIFVNLLGWAIATASACATLYGLYDAFNGHPLNSQVSALYNALNRTVWGAAVSWVIFACATGNGGFVNTLLSWKAFVPLSRLTYCAYLIHPIIMYIYYYGHKVPFYLTDIDFVYIFFGHLLMSYFAAFVVTLAWESPFMGLEKVIFGSREKKRA